MERLEVLLRELDGRMSKIAKMAKQQWGCLKVFVEEKLLKKAVQNSERTREMMQFVLSVHHVKVIQAHGLAIFADVEFALETADRPIELDC